MKLYRPVAACFGRIWTFETIAGSTENYAVIRNEGVPIGGVFRPNLPRGVTPVVGARWLSFASVEKLDRADAQGGVVGIIHWPAPAGGGVAAMKGFMTHAVRVTLATVVAAGCHGASRLLDRVAAALQAVPERQVVLLDLLRRDLLAVRLVPRSRLALAWAMQRATERRRTRRPCAAGARRCPTAVSGTAAGIRAAHSFSSASSR